jgi:hypothetical protein
MEWSTHDSVEIGLHKLFVEIHFIEIPIRGKDNVHVIQTSDLSPIGEGRSAQEKTRQKKTSGLSPYRRPLLNRNLTFLCLRKWCKSLHDETEAASWGREGRPNRSDMIKERWFKQSAWEARRR